MQPAAGLGDGVFTTIDEAVRAARTAFLAYVPMGLDRRYAIVKAVRERLRPEVVALSEFAVDERTNALLVRATPESMAHIKELIAQLDRAQ